MTRAWIFTGCVITFGMVVVFELDRQVARMVRIWRQERRRKARGGYLL